MTTSDRIPRQFWLMRIPDYIRVGYQPTSRDAYPLAACGQSAQAARRALSLVANENHFIAALRLNPTPTVIPRKQESTKAARPLPTPEPTSTPPAPYASVIIAYDGTTLKVESTGARNGMRTKLDVSLDELPDEIRWALVDQMDKIRIARRTDLMSVQGQNIQYVGEEHNIALARKIWGNDVAESRVMRARLRYSSETAGNVDPDGRLKREKTTSIKPLPEPMEL